MQLYNPVIKQQDEELGKLSEGVDRLHRLAIDINDESKLQNKMLDRLGDDMTKAETKMDTTNNQLLNLLKTHIDQNTCVCIMILVIILFILVMCVAYT